MAPFAGVVRPFIPVLFAPPCVLLTAVSRSYTAVLGRNHAASIKTVCKYVVYVQRKIIPAATQRKRVMKTYSLRNGDEISAAALSLKSEVLG